MDLPPRYERSQTLFRRAQELIPGGIHLSGRPLLDPPRSPLYFDRGKGGRIWDVDGHEYIDLFMAYGPYLLGYDHEEVNRAAIEQAGRGGLLSMNHPLHLRFAEALIRRFPGAEMAVFMKTGSEATTAALRIARGATGRRKVARCGYHGWHDWCLPLEPFTPEGLAEQVLEFRGREPATLRALFEAHAGEIAAVIVAPEMIFPPSRKALQDLIDITHQHGAVFILDEVKTAFRTRPGSIQQHVGVVPDMTTLSKALGNGWPIAAVVGKRAVMQAGAGMHLSATYHGDPVAMAAALKTLEIIDTHPVQDHVFALGQRLIDGLNALARQHDLPAEAYGEPLPPMPFVRFTHPDPETNDALRTGFYAEALARGVLFHPRHLWFISYAHTPGDIDRVLDVADSAMGASLAQLPKKTR